MSRVDGASIGVAGLRGVVRGELRRKSRAVAQAASNVAGGQCQALQDSLANVVRAIARDEQALKIVDVASRAVPGEPRSVTALRTDFAAYAYYCATLREVFNDDLRPEQMVRATGAEDDLDTFNALSAARHAFALDTQLAWQEISLFREAWGLQTLAWPAPDQDPGPGPAR